MRISFIRKGKKWSVSVQPTTFPLDIALDLVYFRLGMKIAELDNATKQRYGLESGLLIQDVRKGSEAGRIGLESGDLILKVNDIPVRSLDEFKKAISRYHHLSSLTLLVRRGQYGYSLTLPF
jgi:serine protease Do